MKERSDQARLLGQKGEAIAADYLVQKGYEIVARNWYFDHKEIDIIARQGKEIVIVEVKTRDSDYFEEPWEAVSLRKVKNLVEAADAWLNQHKIDQETRFDVISILFFEDQHFEITHFPGAFTPPVE